MQATGTRVWCDVQLAGCDAPTSRPAVNFVPQCQGCGIDVCRGAKCSEITQSLGPKRTWERICAFCAKRRTKQASLGSAASDVFMQQAAATTYIINPKEGTPEVLRAKSVGERPGAAGL